VVGGPHVSALAKETLSYIDAIDSVVIGEGEQTFLELLDRMSAGKSIAGTPGLACRSGTRFSFGPRRDRIAELDTIPSVHKHYRTHLFMSSRGCPGQCSFCAKQVMWGRTYRAHSVEYVLDGLEAAIGKLPVKMVMVKDDTFTVDRKRVLRICEGIRRRNLNFLWSCDTRADALDEEVLRSMRLAGCQRLSIGVESGSPKILRNIHKNVRLEQVTRATELAKKVGLQVRFFMMLGNRGETAATFRESLEFVCAAGPHQAIFSCLSVYPGTVDFEFMKKFDWIDSGIFFTDDFQELKTPFDATEADTKLMSDWFEANRGVRTLYVPSVRDCEDALGLLGDLHTAHVDLGAAYFRSGDFDNSRKHLHKALELNHPTPGLVFNYLACISAMQSDFSAMLDWLHRAQIDPLHSVVAHNTQIVKQWQDMGSPASEPPQLRARHDFEILEIPEQPSLPGPLPRNFAGWGESDC